MLRHDRERVRGETSKNVIEAEMKIGQGESNTEKQYDNF